MSRFFAQLLEVYNYMKADKRGRIVLFAFFWATLSIPVIAFMSQGVIDAIIKSLYVGGLLLVIILIKNRRRTSDPDVDGDGMIRHDMRPTEEEYNNHRHVKWLALHSPIVWVIAIPVYLLVSLLLSLSPAIPQGILGWWKLAWLALTLYIQAGVYWYWNKGWVIQAYIGSAFVTIVRRSNPWFFISGSDPMYVPVSKITMGGDGTKTSWFEDRFAKRSSTLTLETPDQADSGLHGMKHILDAGILTRIIRWNQTAQRRDEIDTLAALRDLLKVTRERLALAQLSDGRLARMERHLTGMTSEEAEAATAATSEADVVQTEGPDQESTQPLALPPQ